MISINATLFVQVIQFLILVFILNRIMFRPILKVIRDRSRYIEKRRNDIGNLEEETVRLRDEYVSRETETRKKTAQTRSEIRNEGISKAEEFESDSRKRVAEIKTEADKEAEAEIEQTRPLLQGEAAGLADEIIERMIGRRM